MLDIELIPAAQKNSRRLMIVLHGLGDSMDGYRWLPDALKLPRLNYLLVDAPDQYFGGYAWYDFAGNSAPGILRSRKLLFELLDEQSKNGFPSAETILFGFSQGCLMSMDVGLRYPHKLAGVVAISGHVHEPEQALKEVSPVVRNQRFLVTHGKYDTLIPINLMRKHTTLLKTAGLAVDWVEFPKGHTIDGESELEVIRNFVTSQYAA